MKRRLVAFLILAVAATSSGLIFRIGEPYQNIKISEHKNRAQLYETLSRQQNAETATNKNNLTESFAEQVTKEWIEKNPAGPEFIDGQQWLNVSRPEEIVQAYLEKEIKKFDPNDLIPKINDGDIKITYEKTPAVIETYAETIQKIETAIEQTNINKTDFSIDDAKKISKTNDVIVNILTSAEVPDILSEFHKQQLLIIILQKKFIDAAINYEEDPVQTILIAQNTDFFLSVLEKNIEQFEQEIKKLEKISFNDYQGNETKNISASILFIKQAHALVLVSDIIHQKIAGAGIVKTLAEWAADAGRWLAEKGWTIAVEALKKRLLDMIVDQIVRWIQGGGEPKFITDWRGFMRDAFDIAFDETIKQLGLGFICSPFNLQVRLLLERPPTFSQQITCRLDQVVGSIESFYANFENGGWLAYQELWRPSGNPFGLALLGFDEMARKEAEIRDAKRSEGIANQGFLSVKRCVEYDVDEDLEGNPICIKEEIITPGKTVGDAAAQAVGADIAWLVNSRDLSAYVAAIANAFINRLVREGAGLLTVGTQSAPSAGYIPAGLTGNCAGLTGTTLTACLDAVEATENLQNQVSEDCRGLSGTELEQCVAGSCQGLEGVQLADCLGGFLTVAITAPLNNSTVSATITITARAAYREGIERVEFYINNVLVATDSETPYSITINTLNLADGQYAIIVKAIGSDGTSKDSASVTITVKNEVDNQEDSGGD